MLLASISSLTVILENDFFSIFPFRAVASACFVLSIASCYFMILYTHLLL